jgi:hypothetical protein
VIDFARRVRTNGEMRSCVSMLALVTLTAAGCGSAPARLSGGVYRAKDTAFRLGPTLRHWQPQSSDADVAFYEPSLDAVMMANSDCSSERDPPLSVATNTLMMGFTDRQITSEEVVSLDGRDALHRRMRAKLDGVPLAIEAYVLKKDGCIYDLVYLSPPDSAALGAPDFHRFVAGFSTVDGKWTARRGAGAW